MITLTGIGQTEASTSVEFRHSEAVHTTCVTIDNYPLSIALDVRAQISDSGGPEPGKSRRPGVQIDERTRPLSAPSLFRKHSAAGAVIRCAAPGASGRRGRIRAAFPAPPWRASAATARTRRWVASARPPRAGPAPARRTHSPHCRMIHERCASRPRRALVTAGISIAVRRVGRRAVGHRDHDRDDAIALAPRRCDQRARPVLDPLLVATPMIVGPQIAV